MNSKTTSLSLWLGLCFTLCGVLLLVALTAPATQADDTLPDRATPTPVITDTPSDDDDDGDSPVVGAYIGLTSSVDGWATVQWLGDDGNWHVVEGWQGNLVSGQRQWWVHPKDFGTGPFRWIVQQGQNGEMVGTSEPFNLPGEINEMLSVTIIAE